MKYESSLNWKRSFKRVCFTYCETLKEPCSSEGLSYLKTVNVSLKKKMGKAIATLLLANDTAPPDLTKEAAVLI